MSHCRDRFTQFKEGFIVGIKIAVPKETAAHEKRVAASPDTIKKLIAQGCMVTVEKDAGLHAAYTNDAYKAAGAKVAKDFAETVKGATAVLKVQAPDAEEIKLIPAKALLIALLAPHANDSILKACAKNKIDSFSMEYVPRITRAQSMDVLSSQSNLAGYKSVLDAAEYYPHAFPMMMTAAGTIPPAKVFVMGAGVAGLQAIATAKRLGAVVSATDVRPASKEQVQSLGGTFVAVENDEFKQAETAGGYAKEMSDEYKKEQAALIETHIAKQDIVITTALIPGRPAPKLVSEDMVKSMKTGSVIVDLAAETGGNCALTKLGQVVEKHGVTILGHHNVPSRLAADASALYAKNILNLLNLIIDYDSKTLSIDWEDDIIKGLGMTKDGEIVHPRFSTPQEAKKPEAAKEDAKPKAAEAEKEDSKETASPETAAETKSA